MFACNIKPVFLWKPSDTGNYSNLYTGSKPKRRNYKPWKFWRFCCTTTSLGSNPNFSSVFAQGGLPVAGVQYDPYTSGGVIADAVTGLPLVTGVGVKASGYTLAAYLDANGSARYAAGFSGSIENSGALTLGAGYNNANPVSMASGVVSSSNIGEEWDVSCNYGSSNFLLGEDAERWCNV